MFDAIRKDEVVRAHQVFVARKKMIQPRTSSILHAVNHRLSLNDTEMLYLAVESMKRLSVSESLGGIKKVPIAKDIVTSEL